MKTINREELKNKILTCEELLPGDKISLERLNTIANKYNISPLLLATNIFEVSLAAYNALSSIYTNSKNIIILKYDLPDIIDEAIKYRDIILKNENLKPGNKIIYKKLQDISKKYNIREKILALYTFDITNHAFINFKNTKNKYACILQKTNKPNDNEDIEIIKLRKKILDNENLKPEDKINYEKLLTIANKYDVDTEVLALDIFLLSKNSFNHIKYDEKRNATILRNYYSKDKTKKLKDEIIKNENLKPYDSINYKILLEIANKYNINDKTLAINILGMTDNQYYNIKYNSYSTTNILKNNYDYISKKQLNKLKEIIYQNENLYDGYRLSYEEFERICDKYQIKPIDLQYILGITHNSLYFIKNNRQYNTIIKNNEIFYITQFIEEFLEKNRYYTIEEIEEICKNNNITIDDFTTYILSFAYNFEINYFLTVLKEKKKVWIGEKHNLSEEFINNNSERLQKVAHSIARNVYLNYYKVKKLDMDFLTKESLNEIITKCGDLEKNFDNEILYKLIFLRIRLIMLGNINNILKYEETEETALKLTKKPKV